MPHVIRDLDDIPQFLQDDKLKTLQNETTDLSTHRIGRTSSIAVGVIFSIYVDLLHRYGYKVPMVSGYFVTITSALGSLQLFYTSSKQVLSFV